jgi:hypothetical protein
MTKGEILEELRRTGQLDTRRRSDIWLKAFELYNSQVTHRANKLNPSCGSCYSKLRAWLQS